MDNKTIKTDGSVKSYVYIYTNVFKGYTSAGGCGVHILCQEDNFQLKYTEVFILW